MKADVKDYAMIGALVLGAFVVYKVVKVGENATTAVGKTVGEVVDYVGNIPNALGRAAKTAYAETATFVTGTKHYSPSALDAGMTRVEALAYADENIDSRERTQRFYGEKILVDGFQYELVDAP